MTTFICGQSKQGNAQKLVSIPLDGKATRETEKAFCVVVNDQNVWLPKSQISDFKVENDIASFWCPMWLITEKSLEVFIDTSFEPSLFD